MNDEDTSGARPAPKRRAATAVTGRALQQPRDPERQARAERWEDRFAIPVLVAALVSVPAVFLMTTGGTTAMVGRVLNWASVAVLIGESIVLIALSKDVADWLRAHKWELLLVALAVPAVVFAVGPVQILRLVLSVGTLRVLRVRRILRAGLVVARRMRLGSRRKKIAIAVAAVPAAVFLAIVLANPQSRTRRVLAWIIERIGLPLTIIAAVVLAAALAFAVRWLAHTRLVRRIRDIRSPSRRRRRREPERASGP